MTWNFDMTSAPLDQKLWLASVCGKVIPTSWDKKRGQWAGFATNGTPPVAWQPYVVPAHPNTPVQVARAVTTEPKATAESEPEQSVQIRRPDPLFILDDCGSGQ